MNLSFYRPAVPQLTVEELEAILSQNNDILLLDVRQPEERAKANIGGINIPVSMISEHIDDLSKYQKRKVIVYCRTGARSQMAASFLISMGFQNVFNLEGGIYAWSIRIDPTIPIY
jgi:rhodanese-related sulfurtransferase